MSDFSFEICVTPILFSSIYNKTNKNIVGVFRVFNDFVKEENSELYLKYPDFENFIATNILKILSHDSIYGKCFTNRTFDYRIEKNNKGIYVCFIKIDFVEKEFKNKFQTYLQNKFKQREEADNIIVSNYKILHFAKFGYDTYIGNNDYRILNKISENVIESKDVISEFKYFSIICQ